VVSTFFVRQDLYQNVTVLKRWNNLHSEVLNYHGKGNLHSLSDPIVGLKVKNIEPRDMQDHGTLVNIQAPTELNLGKFLFLKDVNI